MYIFFFQFYNIIVSYAITYQQESVKSPHIILVKLQSQAVMSPSHLHIFQTSLVNVKKVTLWITKELSVKICMALLSETHLCVFYIRIPLMHKVIVWIMKH